jgi:hypothetical protein
MQASSTRLSLVGLCNISACVAHDQRSMLASSGPGKPKRDLHIATESDYARPAVTGGQGTLKEWKSPLLSSTHSQLAISATRPTTGTPPLSSPVGSAVTVGVGVSSPIASSLITTSVTLKVRW